MPTAVLHTHTRLKTGLIKTTATTKTITHNNRRLYTEAGRTYEYIGNDGSGNRIYRDTKSR